MSGPKRTVLKRPRSARIDAETLQLFVTLEATPMRQRRSQAFKQKSRELATRLGLLDEWFCSVTSVLDRAPAPCHPPGYKARDDWFRCRAVRQQLLEAAGRAQGAR